MPTLDRRDTDTADLLARKPNESFAAHRAFLDYVAMGSGGKGRSLRDLLATYVRRSSDERLTDQPPTIKWGTLSTWSLKHSWIDRCTAHDEAQRAEDGAARALLRAERRAALEDADWEQGGMVRQRVTELLLEMPKFLRRTISRTEKDGTITEVITLALSAGPGELARALKLASEIQRLSVGVATEIHEVSGPNGGPLQTEIVYSYETAIAGIAGRSGEDRDAPSENTSAGDGPTLGQIDDGRGD